MALSLLDTMPGGAILYDQSGNVVGINATARRLFGVKARDILGRPVSSLFADSNWQMIVRTGLPTGAQRVSLGPATYVRVELPVFADGRVVAVLAHFMGRDIGILREVLPKLPVLADSELTDNQSSSAPHLQSGDPAPAPASLSDIKGTSRAIREARQLAAKAARTDMPVLIQGEPGTEIEAFARAIHDASQRAAREFVAVNSRAATESLLLRELFGMGEESGEGGKLDQACGGTLYLEEISEMPLGVQSRLARAMQERGLGHAAVAAGTVRLVASSHRDLAGAVAAGGFREDLYYRLNVIRLEIPPLRVRPEDIRALADSALARLNQLYANQGLTKRMSGEGLEMLLRYSWPGNVAELESVVSRAYCLSEGEEILAAHLPAAFQQISQVPTDVVGQKTLDEIITEVERGVILQALRATGHNKSRTAKLLGLPRSSFYEKLTRYGLMTRPD
jgi:transcriptional regulator with PAS, ATPase and Fis domain